MRKINGFAMLSLSVLLFAGCGKDELDFVGMEGITFENYPITDGSTSTDPLNRMVAAKLLGAGYEWWQQLFMNGSWYLSTSLPDDFVIEKLKSSQTHNSFINLIEKKADLILSARKMSDDEKAYAAESGVTLIETPIAMDAFIFIVNRENPVNSLSTQQLKDIYTGKITNWKTVGGNNAEIVPYVRNANSGSQELMETLFMKGLPIFPDVQEDWERDLMIPSMSFMFGAILGNKNSLGYTVYYYKEMIVRDAIDVKSLAVDGVSPNKNTIKNKKYPYVAEVYAVIRSDSKPGSMTYKLYEWLQSKEAKSVISECGFIPVQ